MSTRYRWIVPVTTAALLGSAAVGLAQGAAQLFLPNVTKNYAGPTPTQPPPTPGPTGSCSALLNAATLSGPFTFSFTGADQYTFNYGLGHTEDLTASIQRTMSATLTFSDRVADVDEDGNLLSVDWDLTAITQPEIVVNDAWTKVESGPPTATYSSGATGGTLHLTGVEGALTMFADCTYTMTVWPWADQTIDGLPGYDNVFYFRSAFVPATSGNLLSAAIQSPVYHSDQNTSPSQPRYTVDLASNRTAGGGNTLSIELLRAETENSAPLRGAFTETATITWSLSPAP